MATRLTSLGVERTTVYATTTRLTSFGVEVTRPNTPAAENPALLAPAPGRWFPRGALPPVAAPASANASRIQGIPVSPTAPTDGQLMRYNATSGLWEPATVSSGASAAWVGNHPDTPPASPSSYDRDWQNGLATYDGTTLGSPTTAPAVIDNALRVMGGTVTGFDIKGAEWLCPAVPFTAVAKIRRTKPSTNYHIALFMLRAGTTLGGAGQMTGIGWYNNGGFYSQRLSYNRYDTLTNRNALLVNDAGAPEHTLYAKLKYDGTNIACSISPTGHPNSFANFYTDTAASLLGAAPGRWLVGMDTYGSSAQPAFVDWVRFTTP